MTGWVLPLLLVLLTTVPVAAQELRREALGAIEDVVRREIAANHIPGAVVLVGQGDKVVYREAFGWRSVEPEKRPMTVDTIFDLASLTKPIVTATAVMQLVEAGKLSLDEPVAQVWPEFAGSGKEAITVRQLLTHVSGLKAGLADGARGWSGRGAAMTLAAAEVPRDPPGRRFHYSDVNYLVLGELVRRISGETLNAYAVRHIFRPLKMKDAGFLPGPAKLKRIAPTDREHGKIRWGVVQDPTAARMGGVAGSAGVFATADDLARFARMILDGGRLDHVVILKPETVAEMIRPQGDGEIRRGLGWDFTSPYAIPFRDGSFGHTGYTGTALWLDPASGSYLIILTNRVHPDGHGQVKALRSDIAAIVVQALGSNRERD
jgi:CubicO group peptidase (beta-lactamase class C family)